MVLWVIPGAVLGILSTLSQWWTVAHLHPNAPLQSVTGIIGGTIIRLVLTGGLLVVALQQGVVAGLAAFAGWWLARTIMLRFLTARPALFDRFDTTPQE